MKRNEQNSDNGEAGAKPAGRNAGSTIIAVIAAMLFIGVVTASMLKNTGSMSTASIGYSNLQIMSSTVRSGMIATETYFENTDSAGTLGLIIQSMNANNGSPQKKPLVFAKGTPLARDQHFSSRLDTVFKKDTVTARSRFEVKSGRTQNGRDLKTAMVYYDMNVRIRSTKTFNAQNAVFSEGNLNNGDAGIDVRNGPATFVGDVKFQNTASAIFNKDVYFGGKAEFNTDATFNDKVYFHDNVTMQNLTNTDIFKSSVGFNQNISAPGASSTSPKDFSVNGNVWINGTFGTGSATDDEAAKSVKFTNVGAATNQFHFTNSFQAKKTSLNLECNNCPTTSCMHQCHHPITLSTQVEHFSGDGTYHSSQVNIANEMNMGTLDSRRDPELDVDLATDPSNGGTDKTYNLQEVMTNGEAGHNTTVSADILNKAYAKAKNDNKLTNDGYMVVRLGASATDNHFSWPSSTPGTTTFNEKIIFVLENSYSWSGSYFPTTTNSSTLIYVKDNAVLNEFYIRGEFNGLIYTDIDNTPTGGSNKIKADPVNGKIVGAIHNHSSSNLQWNTTGGTVPPVIEFSAAALNKFATLVKCQNPPCEENNYTADYTDVINETIHLKPFGYYFY